MAHNHGFEYVRENNSDIVVGNLSKNTDRDNVVKKKDNLDGLNIRRASLVDILNVAEPKQGNAIKSPSTRKRFVRRVISQSASGDEGTNTISKKDILLIM